MPTDQEIIAAFTANPDKGFNLLMSAYMQPVYWHIRRLVVSHADAQDTLQETFVRVFRTMDRYNSQHTLKAWIYRIATNEALRLLSQRQHRISISLDEAPADTFNLMADNYVDYTNMAVVKLQQAIHTLPLKQQLAFNFRYYDDLSYDEISQITGLSADNIKANYHVAKNKILQYINNSE